MMRMTMQEAIASGIVFPASSLPEVIRDGDSVTFPLPLEIVSEMNARCHWVVKAKRTARQKRIAHIATMQHAAHLRRHIQTGKGIRLAITLVRLMAKGQRLFDSDNLAAGFKAIRDGVAFALGLDDGSDRLEWHYAQEPGAGMRGGVRAEIARIDF